MIEREYIVSLNKGVDYEQFWFELEARQDGIQHIPDRNVEVVNARPGSMRSTHFALTDQEADELRNDPRVYSVEIPPQQRDDISIGFNAIQTGNFTKITSSSSGISGNQLNFGIKRCISPTNNYGTGTTVSGDYTYPLDGTGVDIVIQDSGVQGDHPEFNDADGNSRYQSINWYIASGLSGSQSANHDRDYDGHGTHCGGVAGGLTYGWAKNAHIYSLKVAGLEGSGDSGTGIDVTDCFDVIKLWHRNKPVDPVTGAKRPTIVNMSWGYGTYFSNILGGEYRTQPWSGTTRQTQFGMIGAFDGTGYRCPVRVASVDVDIEELLDEGVHVVIAAGNNYQKIDIPSGIDYPNFFEQDFGGFTLDRFYHRGSSPFSYDALMVGATDSVVYSATEEQKATYSNCGPGVDIYAPGSRIMSCTSTINSFNGVSYYLDSNYRQCSISGTSFAAPQICGAGALLLQLNPKLTPAQLKQRLIEDSQSVVYSTGLNNDYTDSRSISDGEPRFLYHKFNSSKPYTASKLRLSNGNLRIS